jgi:hypothetical protein
MLTDEINQSLFSLSVIPKVFTSGKLASTQFQEVALWSQHAIMTVATIVAPYAEVTFKTRNGQI